jgi:hypothetical protein
MQIYKLSGPAAFCEFEAGPPEGKMDTALVTLMGRFGHWVGPPSIVKNHKAIQFFSLRNRFCVGGGGLGGGALLALAGADLQDSNFLTDGESFRSPNFFLLEAENCSIFSIQLSIPRGV